jgi:hypothetical protein
MDTSFSERFLRHFLCKCDALQILAGSSVTFLIFLEKKKNEKRDERAHLVSE